MSKDSAVISRVTRVLGEVITERWTKRVAHFLWEE